MNGHLSLHHANYAKDEAIMQTGNMSKAAKKLQFNLVKIEQHNVEGKTSVVIVYS